MCLQGKKDAVGVSPTSLGWTASCSTTELSASKRARDVVAATGAA